MKRIITLLCLTMLSTVYIYGQEEDCDLPGYVSVSGNIYSARSSETYQLTSSDSTDDLHVNFVDGPFVLGYSISNNNTDIVSVTIYFQQCQNQSINTSVSFNYDQITECVDDVDRYGLFRTQSLTIRSNPSASPLGTPTITQGTTGSYAQEFYTFTASVAGATSYNWDVDGGTITGPTNGATIKVIADASACGTYPGHPNKLKARAQAVNVCETSGFSSWSERYVGAPIYVGDISGPTIVGLYYGDYSGYTSSAYVPSGAIHEYVWSVSGPFQLGSNGTNQNFVFVNTYTQSGSGTLYVYVKNVCGQTITKSKSISIGNGLPGGGGWGGIAGGDGIGPDADWVDVVETKVVSNGGNLKLIIPNFEEKDLQIYIYDINGRIIEKIQPKSFEVLLNRSKFKNGIYIVKTISKKEMSTSKFKVSD